MEPARPGASAHAPPRVLWAFVAALVLAIVVARAVLAGGDAVVLLLLAAPALFGLLAWRFGWVVALLASLFFLAASAAARLVLLESRLAVLPLLLLPFLAVVALVAWRVSRKLVRARRRR